MDDGISYSMGKRIISSAFAVSGGVIAALGLAVAQTTDRAPTLTGNTGAIATPGIGKILLAFALTLAVGVAAIWLLRRMLPWLPKLAGQSPSTDALRVIASRNVHIGLKLHVVETEGTTVLVAESKNGIAMLALSPRIDPATTTDVSRS